MEEKQIQEFVHRVTEDTALRQDLLRTPESVVGREGFSPRVARIVMQLVPHLTVDKPTDISLKWWQ